MNPKQPMFTNTSCPAPSEGHSIVDAESWSLRTDAFGRLVLVMSAGETHVGVVPVRSFPLAAPDEGISLVNTEGREVVWIERLSACSEAIRAQMEPFLAAREFSPVIEQVLRVSSFTTPSTWDLLTDRGLVKMILKSEDDIRRLPVERGVLRLRITGSNGVQYRVEDFQSMDKGSRKLLDRFL